MTTAPFEYFVYDSQAPGTGCGSSRRSNQMQIMVINIQSFQKDVADKDTADDEEELKKLNVIYRENDRMSGRRPIEFIQAAQSHRHYRRAAKRGYDAKSRGARSAISTRW